MKFPMPKIVIGMPNSGSIPWATAGSLIATLRACDEDKLPVRVEAPVGCSVVQWARSAIAESFLKSDFTHLMFIDSDIVWSPADFFRLVGFAAILDVVCAIYPFKKEPTGFLINTDAETEANGLGCIKIKSTGLGFTILKRAVMEKVAATKPRVFDPVNGLEYSDIFRVDRTAKGGPRGEDVAFFDDVREAGFDVWLDPSIRLGHHGYKIYRGDPIDALGLEKYAKQEK